ncbi:leucine-rich repeat extensin-like protein 6 [Silene latifolia]|uniref:leucine-rich repeat extensin-like protein 6 n=1 Tax=Silene latifolia TaxID=37657 RepID=UPI003D786528
MSIPFLPTLFSLLLLFSLPIPTHQQSNETIDFNPRLQNAYAALQAWKDAITSDPNNFTANWVGYNVCSYRGVYCAPSLDDPTVITVAGIDLNHASLSGTIPEEVGSLLTDLALLHLNSNHFLGPIPRTFTKLKLLFELDISNNNFCGEFPSVLFNLTSIKFLDVRFNHFDGAIPPEVFKLKLDALFLNNNNFTSYSPGSVGNSPVSVMVMGNNNLNRCFPPRISRMRKTLDEVILTNCGLTGCLPKDIGKLSKATVLDVSFNDLTGTLPESIGNMKLLEELDVGYNNFYGKIPSSICSLPKLQNFTYSHNFFCSEAPQCLKLKEKDDTFNCIPHKPLQRSPMECHAFLAYPPQCSSFTCNVTSPPPPSLPPSPIGY